MTIIVSWTICSNETFVLKIRDYALKELKGLVGRSFNKA
jgi:hypothetical protein